MRGRLSLSSKAVFASIQDHLGLRDIRGIRKIVLTLDHDEPAIVEITRFLFDSEGRKESAEPITRRYTLMEHTGETFSQSKSIGEPLEIDP